MPLFDLPESQLEHHRTATLEPDGLDGWWAERLAQTRELAWPTRTTRHRPDAYGPTPVWDVEFAGAHGDPARGWYIRPAGSEDTRVPIVVTFVGYGGGRGVPANHLAIPSAGFAHLVMDTRGQGGNWTIGATGDRTRGVDGPEYPGFMTRGIADPEHYYYTRLMLDAARAVEVAAELPGVDADRIAVSGASQGGGLALAAAALSTTRVKVCHADVPFLCDFQRAITLSPTAPYIEIAHFLAQHVDAVATALNTLRYVDCALLARRITADCLLSVGLMDTVCPPSTVFAAYNEIPSTKQIAVYPFGVHAVAHVHAERALQHLQDVLAR